MICCDVSGILTGQQIISAVSSFIVWCAYTDKKPCKNLPKTDEYFLLKVMWYVVIYWSHLVHGCFCACGAKNKCLHLYVFVEYSFSCLLPLLLRLMTFQWQYIGRIIIAYPEEWIVNSAGVHRSCIIRTCILKMLFQKLPSPKIYKRHQKKSMRNHYSTPTGIGHLNSKSSKLNAKYQKYFS